MTQPSDTDHQRLFRPTRNRSERAEPGEVNPVLINLDPGRPGSENNLANRPLLIGDGHHRCRHRDHDPLDKPVRGGQPSSDQPRPAVGSEHARGAAAAQAGQGQSSCRSRLRGMQVDQVTGLSQAPDPPHGRNVAGVGRAPHLEPLPGRSPFPGPARQITGGGTGHRHVVPAINGRLDEVTHADGHAVYGGLRDDQDATGSSGGTGCRPSYRG